MENSEIEKFERAAEIIKAAGNILLVSHRRPDGDTLGASCALNFGLGQLGKKTTLACIDQIPARLEFIPGTENYVNDFSLNDFDLIIISDAGASHMTGFHEKYPQFLSKKVPIINIDHHISNDNFGTVNIIDAKASSATMIIWKLFKHLEIKLTREIALALLAGIYNDTGGFIHSNTTQETFQVAHELMQAGISVSDIVQPLFKQSSYSQLRLWGYILETLRINDRKVLSSVVTRDDFRELDARSSDTGGIIDIMNTIPGIRCALLLAEDDAFVKGSLRTQRDDISVSDIAAQFGGGGHRKAAGFRVKGRLERETVWKIIPAK